MAELTPKERLQPSLLDRLTDDEPLEQGESREKRVLSPLRLRESVRRDLSWLFNTANLEAAQDLEDYPHVARSVVNYGLPDLAGRTSSSVDLPTVEKLLKRAIWDFEPRLMQKSIKVTLAVDHESMSHNAMHFSIEADLWAQPLPLRLFLRTELDLEDGDAEVTEVTGIDVA